MTLASLTDSSEGATELPEPQPDPQGTICFTEQAASSKREKLGISLGPSSKVGGGCMSISLGPSRPSRPFCCCSPVVVSVGSVVCGGEAEAAATACEKLYRNHDA